MSELQISLLSIGILVVAAVYLYGAWQHRRYRNRFGAAFKAGQPDALYQGARASEPGDTGRGDTGPGNTRQAPFGDLPDNYAEAAETDLFPGLADPPPVEDDPCKAVGAETDYVAVMFAAAPLNASVLAPVWPRRFDFGAPIHVCGVRAAEGTWERVGPESPHAWDTFRIALQLADRNGPVSRARIEEFRDLLRDVADPIRAEVNLPDVDEALAHAERLDAFCAEVDQMIGLNILPAGDQLLTGIDVARVGERHGLVLRADGAFHLLDGKGQTLFTLRNFDESPFLAHELDEMPVIGLSLQLDVPRVENPARRFEEMVVLARVLGEELRAEVVDDHRLALGDAGIAMIRKQVAAIDKKMQGHSIAPGGALARRLFS
jgi:FtsZ-interacting cell division protein ZipA